MPECSYCNKKYEIPRGLTVVDIVGRVRYYCSGKCRKYASMGRAKGKWTRKVVEKISKAE